MWQERFNLDITSLLEVVWYHRISTKIIDKVLKRKEWHHQLSHSPAEEHPKNWDDSQAVTAPSEATLVHAAPAVYYLWHKWITAHGPTLYTVILQDDWFEPAAKPAFDLQGREVRSSENQYQSSVWRILPLHAKETQGQILKKKKKKKHKQVSWKFNFRLRGLKKREWLRVDCFWTTIIRLITNS